MKTPLPAAKSGNRPNLWPALALLMVVATYRVFLAWLTVEGGAGAVPEWMLNFTPMAALALAGGCFLPRGLNVVVPVGALLVSDVLINALYGAGPGGVQTAGRYACLLVMVAVGVGLRRRLRLGTSAAGGSVRLIAASVLGSALFYLVTNTLSWLGSADYPQTLTGWTQALTTGVPGYPPTWVFFRNALVSDLLVSMLLAASCLRWGTAGSRRRYSLPDPARVSELV